MKNVMPIGFVQDGKWYQKFDLMEIDEALERVIHNVKLQQTHPQVWIKQVVAGLLDNIEGEQIGWDVRESNFKKIPKIVDRIPLSDAGYILVAGHVAEFGECINDVEQKCLNCGKKFLTDIDLTKLKVNYAESPIEAFSVDLEKGFIRKSDSKKEKLGFEDIPFNRYWFRVPTIADGIKFEELFAEATRLDFNMRVIQSCLLKVESVDKDGSVIELEKKYREMYGSLLIRELKAVDRTLIRRKFNELPSIEMRYSSVCSKCGEDTIVFADPSNFFPVG